MRRDQVGKRQCLYIPVSIFLVLSRQSLGVPRRAVWLRGVRDVDTEGTKKTFLEFSGPRQNVSRTFPKTAIWKALGGSRKCSIFVGAQRNSRALPRRKPLDGLTDRRPEHLRCKIVAQVLEKIVDASTLFDRCQEACGWEIVAFLLVGHSCLRATLTLTEYVLSIHRNTTYVALVNQVVRRCSKSRSALCGSCLQILAQEVVSPNWLTEKTHSPPLALIQAPAIIRTPS